MTPKRKNAHNSDQRRMDERDLTILREYEGGADPAYLTKRYRTTRKYMNKLLKEALHDG
jgi:Mor family transcriptional regulator